MALNKNIGRNTLSNAGLVLQSRPVLTKSEFGLIEGTLMFHARSGTYPDIDPPRATPCDEFLAGDARTQATLNLFPWLAAQTSKYTAGGFAPGIDTLEVTCQGAKFVIGISDAPIATIPVTHRGVYTVIPTVIFTGGGEVTPARAVARLQRRTIGVVDDGSSYDVGDVLTFLGGSYDRPVKIRVDGVTAGNITAFHALDPGSYAVIPANPVACTGGTGSGATFTVTWRLDAIVVLDGGLYADTPVANLINGAFTDEATIGACVMGARTGGAGSQLTKPFAPVTTVKDTAEVTIYGTPVTPEPGLGTFQARCAATSLAYSVTSDPNHGGDPNIIHYPDGPISDGRIGLIDGVAININDIFLLADGSPHAGLYRLMYPGLGPPNGATWWARRIAEMDEGAEVTSSVSVLVAEGDINAGLWQCTVSGSVTINVTPITFDLTQPANTPNPIPQYIQLYRVTIDYHAIELTFEYMASEFASAPRFIRPEYARGGDGAIAIEAITGVTQSRNMQMEIDSISAIQLISTTADDGTITYSDGPVVAIDESTWRAGVKYVGTAAEFEQIEAGAYYHVRETTTIKIVPIAVSGVITSES